MTKTSLSLALLLGCAGTLSASAQSSESTGIPLGDSSRLHAKLELGVTYDTNPGRLSDASQNTEDGRAMIRPGLELVVPGVSRELRLFGALTVNQYFNVNDNFTDSTYLGANVGGQARLGTDQSKVQFKARDNLLRTPVSLDELGGLSVDETSSPLWYNTGDLRLTLRPFGPALEFDLGYHNRLTIYDDIANAQLHTGLVEVRWSFLPKTTLFVRGEAGIYDVWDDDAESTSNAVPVEGLGGLKGLITPRISTELYVGWSDMLADVSSTNTSGLIAAAIFTYAITDYTQLTIGYKRTIQPAVIVSSYSSDAPFIQGRLGLGTRLSFIGEGRFEWRSYAPLQGTGNDDRENGTVLSADIRAEYWVFEFMRASLGYRMSKQTLDDDADTVSASLNLQEFTRHQIYFNLGFEY